MKSRLAWGDERWDVFLAALAEHLCARDGRSAPAWAESRSLRRLWFPFNSRAARVDAVVHPRRRFAAGGCTSQHRSWRSRERGRAAAGPHGVVLEEAWAVADELRWPRWWLNEQVSAYVARGRDPAAPRVFDHPGLRVSAASPEHLLAMKVIAARRRDADEPQGARGVAQRPLIMSPS